MAQWVRVIAAKPNDLSLIPRTHTVEEKELTPTGYPVASACVPGVHAHTYTPERMYKIN